MKLIMLFKVHSNFQIKWKTQLLAYQHSFRVRGWAFYRHHEAVMKVAFCSYFITLYCTFYISTHPGINYYSRQRLLCVLICICSFLLMLNIMKLIFCSIVISEGAALCDSVIYFRSVLCEVVAANARWSPSQLTVAGEHPEQVNYLSFGLAFLQLML